MGKASATFDLKDDTNVSDLVKAIRQGAKDNDIEFQGDEKQGKASRAGAVITYKVEGRKVTVNVEDSWRSRTFDWDANKIMNTVKEWIAPYIKK